MRLALFDLDNTLLACDSDFEWAQFLIEQGVLDRDAYEDRNAGFYREYLAGTLDIEAFLDFQLKPLSRYPRAQLDAWHAQYRENRIRPAIRPAARALVERHRADLRVMITATNSFVTGPIAREFGIEHLIATEPESVGGEFTGAFRGTPCFREGKVARLDEWLAERGGALAAFESSHFYSDSHNDLPLLERVTHPVAVDADAKLQAHAQRRGWTIMSLAP